MASRIRDGAPAGASSGAERPGRGDTVASSGPRRSRGVSRAGRLRKLLRRAHMYAGLVMLPWLLFFGLSGVLFNHPNVGADVEGERVGAADLGGFSPWDPQRAAARVVEQLNDGREGVAHGVPVPLQLDGSKPPSFEGFTVLGAPAPAGRYMLLLDVQGARGVLVERRARPRDADASFPRVQVELPEYTTAAVQKSARGLLERRGKPVIEELAAHPRIGPELRLRVRDADGQSWNLVYDTRSQSVSGRRSDHFPALGFAQILGKMHTTHHFTLDVGALWFWALFEDLLGLTMVFWAVSGMVMWWQAKSTRLAGAVSFAVALAVAGAVMGATLSHLTFGDVSEAVGPGE